MPEIVCIPNIQLGTCSEAASNGKEKCKIAVADIFEVTLLDIDGEQLRRRNIEGPKPESQLDGDEFYL
jgi:hypothetical protein